MKIPEVISRLRYKAAHIKEKLEPEYFSECADFLECFRWHDMIQHPDDLPEEWKEVLVYHEYYHWSLEKVLPEYGLGMVIGGRWSGEITQGRDVRILAWKYIEAPPKVPEVIE